LEEIALRREAIRLRKLQIQEPVKVEFAEPPTSSEQAPAEEAAEEEEKPTFLAFARVFSGTLRRGQTLFILSPKHNPDDLANKPPLSVDSSAEEIAAVSRHVAKFTVGDLYLMMGRELEPVDAVPAGKHRGHRRP
jgi:ribosome assembly protein 1